MLIFIDGSYDCLLNINTIREIRAVNNVKYLQYKRIVKINII